jgi:hypothetical protein
VQVIEKVIPNTVNYRLEREDHWIKTPGTKAPLGLNKMINSEVCLFVYLSIYLFISNMVC